MQALASLPAQDRAAPPPAFAVEEAYWGYAVRPADAGSWPLRLAQGLAWLGGIGLVVLAAGLLMGPAVDPALDAMRQGLGAVAAAAAALLLWFASRGSVVELQVDLARGELREAVRNRAGHPTVLGRHGLDAVAALEMDRGPGRSATLSLRLQGSDRRIPVASGPVADLGALLRRLQADILPPRQTIRVLPPEEEAAADPAVLDRAA